MENKTFFTKKNIIIASSVAVVLAGALFLISGNNDALKGDLVADKNDNVKFVTVGYKKQVTEDEKYKITVMVKNTGKTIWDKNYALQYFNYDSINSDSTEFNILYVSKKVEPGNLYTFEINTKAPLVTVGYSRSRTIQLQMIKVSGEKQEVFGEVFKGPITIISKNSNMNGIIKVPEAPDFYPTPGEYTMPQSVSFLQKTNNLLDEKGKKPIIEIRYTTDKSEPTCKSGMIFIKPLLVSKTTTFKAITCNDNIPSAIAIGKYTIKTSLPSSPTFVPVPGIYNEPQKISLSTKDPGMSLHYTTDGTAPSCKTGSIYREPIMVFTTTTIKAVACDIENNMSEIATARYTIVNTNRNDVRNKK